MSTPDIDHSDYSVVVKIKPESRKPWRWMIHRAGLVRPVKTSREISYETRAEAQREGNKALQLLLNAHEVSRPLQPELDSRGSQLWSENDDRLLEEMLAKKASSLLVAAKLRRSVRAVVARTNLLGLSERKGVGRPARKQ